LTVNISNVLGTLRRAGRGIANGALGTVNLNGTIVIGNTARSRRHREPGTLNDLNSPVRNNNATTAAASPIKLH